MRKIIILTIFTLILSSLLFPQLTANNIELKTDSIQNLRIFEFNTTTEIEISNPAVLDNPIMPVEDSKKVELNINFKFDVPSLFPNILIDSKIGKWIMFRDFNANLSTDINLAVTEDYEWLTAELDKNTVKVDMFTDYNIAKANLTIKLTKDAPAYKEVPISIKANFTPESNWGFIESGAEIKPKITVDYVADINITTQTNETYIIPPLKPNYIPIKLKNNANGNTTFIPEIKGYPENWEVSFNETEFILSPGEQRNIDLNITATDKEFKNRSIVIDFTGKSSENNNCQIQEQRIRLVFQDDGSQKEEEFVIDISLILILLIAIVLIIIVIYFFSKFR